MKAVTGVRAIPVTASFLMNRCSLERVKKQKKNR